MNTNMGKINESNSTRYEATLITNAIGSPALDADERERYQELFRQLTRDERHEEQAVRRFVLVARARGFDDDGLL